MSFLDRARSKKYGNNEEDEKKESLVTQSNTSSDSSSTGSTFLERAMKKKATASLDGWVKASSVLLDETQSYFDTWRSKDSRDEDEYKSLYERRSSLLAQADSWRKQYADNAEALSHIDSVVSALSDAGSYATKKFDTYSKFDSEDAYQKAVRESGYYQEYGNLSYGEIKDKLFVMPAGTEEYDWLSKYAPTTMTAEDYDTEISSVEAEITNLEAVLDEYKRMRMKLSEASPEDYAYVRLTELRKQYGSEKDIEALISQKRAYINRTNRMKEASSYYDVVNPQSDIYDPSYKSKSGYVSTEEDGLFGSKYSDLTYEIINGNTDAWTDVAIAQAWGKISDDEHSRLLSYEHMEKEDKELYNYIYATKGKEEAQKFLELIQDKINQSQGKYYASQITSIESDFVRALAEGVYGLGAGVDQFDSGVKQFLTNEEKPASATQYASEEIRNSLGGFGKHAYSAAVTVGNMLPSILISKGLGAAGVATKVAQGAGSLSMGFSSAGNAYGQALKEGYSEGQARSYGVLVGASEALLQNLIGGIGSLGGVTDDILLAKASAIDSALLRVSAKLGIKIGSEITEEELQLFLEPTFRSIIFGEDYNAPTIAEMIETAIVTALSTGALEGPGTIVSDVSEMNSTGRTINSLDGGSKALLELSKSVAGVTEGEAQQKLNKQIAAVEKKATNRRVTKLYDSVQSANNSLNKADITTILEMNRFSSEEASDIADAVVAIANGEQLTAKQAKTWEAHKDNDQVKELFSNFAQDDRAVISKRNQQLENFDTEIALSMLAKKNGVERTVGDGSTIVDIGVKKAISEEFNPKGEFKVSDSTKAIRTDNGEEIDIKKVSSVNKDGLVLELADGTTINAKDVSFATGEDALVYEAIAKLGENINADIANKLLSKYDGKNGKVFASGMKQAYLYGFYGFDKSELSGSTFLTSELTEEQRNYAYGLGEKYRPIKDAKDKVVASKKLAKSGKTPSEKGVFYRDKDGNATDISTYLKESNIKLNDLQKTGIEAMRKMSKMMGVRFNVFETWVEDGKSYYLNTDGEVVEGNPNGFYDTTTGEIYIDLNAGNDFQGTMLFTIAHEVTHFMRQWSPEHFTKIAKIVFQHGGMKGNVSKLVANKQAIAKAKGKPISYDIAMEEVVADGMETILKDGKVVEFMADVKKKDYAAWEKLKGWFKNLAKFLRKMVWAYSGQSAQTTEGAMVEEFSQDLLNQIERIFAEGAVASGENYSRVGSIVGQMNIFLDEIMELDTVATIDSSNATPYSGDRKTDIDSGKAVFKAQGGVAIRKDFGRVVIGGRGARQTIYHGNGPAKQAAFPAVKAVIENGIEIARDYNHDGLGFDTITFSAPIKFYGSKSPLAVVVKVFEGVNADKTFYVHEICDAQGNYIQLDESEFEQKNSNTNFVEPTSTVSVADDGIAPTTNIHHDSEIVKSESAEAMDLEVDAKTESVAPTVLKSERTWTESDYVQEREQAAKEIAKAIGVSVKKAKAYIDSVNSIAKMIAEDRVRLDYFSSPGRSSFVSNVEYGGSFDFSTLCKKRRLLTGTFTAIQKALPNTALTADEILKIRNRMKDAGLEVSCGLCYVEGSRANMGQFAKEFLKLYKQYYPDAWQPNMADVNTPDGIEWVRINHPECYEQYEYFWNHYGTLKSGDKNLFASQQKPKLYQLHTEYKGEILSKFNNDDNVEEKNLNGGIRLQSFSDFEIVHLIDTMQIIMDMSRVGLAGQAYTKVPDFAWALGDTGLKINLSLIAKGVDENGRLIFDDVEGMPIAEAMKLRDRYSKNVGTILVAFNDEQLLAAMADERVDFIIPFHRSQWKKSQYAAMGLPAKTKDYTYMQNEKFIKPQYHEYRGRMVQDKATNYMPNEYWDFSKSGKENAEAYLEMCARNNKRPKFYKLLQNNGDGSYSLKADGSTDGYWKLLIDFKMYDNEGNGSPQIPVKPEFNMDEAQRMMNDYQGGHSNFPVAQGVVDSFVEEYKDSHKGALYSDRDNVPTFYSQMAKVVDGVKQEKLGAASIVSMLRGKGVKAEEIKWSGIEDWLDGKKSVTKAELQEFIAGSMLQIEEEVLDNKDRPYTEDQQKRLAEYEAKRDEVAKRLADEWKKVTGEEFPIRNTGADLESAVVNKIIDANLEHKKASFEGRLLAKLKKDTQKVIENNDDFGFDNWKDALRSIHRHRRDFISHYEMSTNDKAVIVKYCNALNAYNELPNKFSDADTDRLRSIARETDPWNRKIMEVKHEHNEEEAKYMTNWKQYSLNGGRNYREMLFRIPGSTYTNESMMTHWKDRTGVLAHARVQDMDTFIGKMLFIEEIQSDWHNAGRKDGYRDPGAEDKYTLSKKMEEYTEAFYASPTADMVRERIGAVGYEGAGVSMILNFLLDSQDSMNSTLNTLSRKGASFTESEVNEIAEYARRYEEMYHQWETAPGDLTAPDAPFKDTYHEYVLKRLLREAAEQDYDSIGWTTAATQDDRWQNNMPHKEGAGKSGFLKAYTIEYDQNIRNFLDKFGKKWGTKVGKTTLDNGTEVWSMAITDSMKESVMTEGQPLYSDRVLMGSLFSGGGTLEAGLIYQMLDKEFAVEYNKQIAATYTDNHGKEHMFVGDVRDFNSKDKQNVFYLHASPVCKNFSPASHSGGETTIDIVTARATARVLEEQMPQVFTVENVKRYKGSEAYTIITDKLTELGYKWDVDVYKASDYGNATKRERMIIRAVKDGQLPAKPEKESSITSWGEATRDLWETDLIPSTLVRSKIEAIRNTPQLKNLRLTKLDRPLMIYDTTKSKQVTFAWADELAPTLTTKCGDARIIMPDGRVYEPTPKFMGRIQGLPDNYKYPKAKTNAFKIIGNGIPTQLTKAVIGGVLDSAYEQTHEGQVLYQDRAEDSVSNRSLLANAFEGLAKNDIERNKIQEYKGKIALIEAEEKKLRELNEQIKELSFAEGKRDTKKIKALRFDAAQASNRINTYDKQLLRLEASKPLQDVLEREKRRAYKKAEERGKEALAEYKARVEAKQQETTEKWRESRKTAVAKARETAEKRDARAKLQKLVLDTVKWISYPAKTDVKCPDILKQPYADFLNGIDLSSKRVANGGDPTKNDLRLANAMGSLATALDRIMTAQDPSQDSDKVLDTGYLDLPADFVQKLRDMTESIKGMMVEGDYVVNNMTAAEVRQMSQMIRTLNHAIKTMSKLYANLRFSNIEELGFDTMEFMDALGEIEKTGGMKDFVEWDNALPYYAFKRFGKGGESVFEGLMDAQDKLAFLAKVIFEFQEKSWTGAEAKAWSEDTHTITLPNGTELTLTTADAMSIYCLSRREQGLQHLLGGGTRVMGIQKGSKKAKDSRSLLTIEDISAIVSSLTDRQKQVAEAMQEFMSTVCSEWGNEISMKRFLTKEFTEKFYFPIESNDENLPTKDPAAQQSDLFRLLNISATKPLTPGANNEVIIRNIFDVFTGHASDMARLNAYGMALLDYMKWLNYREKTANEEGQLKVRGVRKSMEKAYGNAAKSYVLNLVKDVNGRPSDGGDPNILMKWMRAAKTASVGSSLRVATLQLTSYPRAALVLSPKSLTLGLSKKPQIEKAKKYCGIALWKSFGFYDTNIARSIEDQMKGVKDVKQKLIELSLKGAEWGDAITWGALWNACEYEVAQTTKNKISSEEFYQEVANKLREVVYRTQVVDSTLTRSQIMRSKRGMAQEAAAFMSEPTLSANILMDAGFEFNAEKRRTGSTKTAWKNTSKYIGRAVAVYAIGQLTAALLEGLWDAWRDDDDEEFDEKYLDAFIENLLLDLAPFNKLPIVSDVFEAVLAMFEVGFYSSDKMSTTWLTQAVSAVEDWKDALSGNSSVTIYSALYKTTRAISSFFGVSVSGVMREGVALWNNTAGAYDPTLKILTYDRSKGENGDMLLDAMIKGNARQVESLKAEFADEDAYSSAIRSAIKSRYEEGKLDADTTEQYLVKFGGLEADKAYWQVQEWEYETDTGEDFRKYDNFYEAVKTGKNLKSVIKEYTDNGVDNKTLASQITTHFKPLYKEMSNYERAGIKGYLLNAYALLGYDRTKKSKDIDKWLED